MDLATAKLKICNQDGLRCDVCGKSFEVREPYWAYLFRARKTNGRIFRWCVKDNRHREAVIPPILEAYKQELKANVTT